MKQYRKKPVIINAIQWNGKNFDEVMKFMKENHGHKLAYEDAEEAALKTGKIYIRTLEGVMEASKNDFIIQGVNGEYYLCKPDIFEKTYEGLNTQLEEVGGISDDDYDDYICKSDELFLTKKFLFKSYEEISQLKEKNKILIDEIKRLKDENDDLHFSGTPLVN